MVKATLSFLYLFTFLGLGACANLRRALRDDSSNVVTTVSPDGSASVSITTKNDWHEEGVHFVHIRARFNNIDAQQRPICGIVFSMEGFDSKDSRAQFGNFEVLSNGLLRIPPTSNDANPLHYTTLSPNQRPDWFIGAIYPFTSSVHDFPDMNIHEVELCAPGAATAATPSAMKEEHQEQP